MIALLAGSVALWVYPAVFACKAADEESDEEDEAEENQDSWPFHLIPT